MIEFNGNIDQFIDQIGIGLSNSVYLKKKRARHIYYLYWEDKDMWFLNFANYKTNGVLSESPPWIIRSDLKNKINHYIRTGYQMYINE